MEIIKGKQTRAQKVVIYGTEGIGKSTFVANFPDPLFIDTENGTSALDVSRTRPTSWEELKGMIQEVIATPGICKTLVIDTVDSAERMLLDYICKDKNVDGIESIGYGRGYVYAGEEMGKFLQDLDEVIGCNINVVLVSHAQMRKFEEPDQMGSYDRYELKLSKKIGPMVKEWADHLLFFAYKTYTVLDQTGKTKATGGKRVIYTTHQPTWDAKNRAGLPDCIDMDYEKIKSIFGSVRTPLDTVKELMAESDITEEQLQAFLGSKRKTLLTTPLDKWPENVLTQTVIPKWNEIVEKIKGENNNG